jgi:hypothetical protein
VVQGVVCEGGVEGVVDLVGGGCYGHFWLVVKQEEVY